jgi:hypothetical protein
MRLWPWRRTPPPRRAVLHIGTEKTGSTSLQEFLVRNEPAFLARGFAYPASAGRPETRHIATIAYHAERQDDATRELGLATSDQRRAWQETMKAAIDAELARLPQRAQSVIFSSEHLHSRLGMREEVAALKAFLDRHFAEYSVIVYLRRQDRVAASLHSTGLRVGLAGANMLPILRPESVPPYYDYATLLERWSAVFGRSAILPRRLSKDAHGVTDVVADFLSLLGIAERDAFAAVGRRNAAFDRLGIEYLSVVNALRPAPRTPLQKAARGLLMEHLSRRMGAPGLPLRGEAEAFQARFAESNRAVARDWFGREHLFDDDFSEYPTEAPPAPTFADAVAVSLDILEALADSAPKH